MLKDFKANHLFHCMACCALGLHAYSIPEVKAIKKDTVTYLNVSSWKRSPTKMCDRSKCILPRLVIIEVFGKVGIILCREWCEITNRKV